MAALETRQGRRGTPGMQAPDTEAVLWQRWCGMADRDARAALLLMHLPYARAVAAACYGKRVHDEIEFDDYFQLASLGLVEAVDRYDPTRGAQFRTFATARMHGSILDGIERASEKQQQAVACRRLEARHRQSSDVDGDADVNPDSDPDAGAEKPARTPAARTTQQLLQHVAEAGLAFALGWILDGTGLVDADRIETIPFYRSIELHQLRKRVLDSVEALPVQERAVIRSHYLQVLPFEEIATRLGLTRSRISQIHKRALARLRHMLEEAGTCNVLA